MGLVDTGLGSISMYFYDTVQRWSVCLSSKRGEMHSHTKVWTRTLQAQAQCSTTWGACDRPDPELLLTYYNKAFTPKYT